MNTAIAMCLTVQLQMLNDANVPADVLSTVRHEILGIFARAGIEIVWHGAETSAVPAYTFAVKIIPRSLQYGHANPHVMGVALREERGTLVYAFFGRVESFARARRIPTGTILAHVIAHEIGHLLLPQGWHSQTGLMRGTWDRAHVENALRGRLTFTSEEIRAIRADVPSP